MKKQNNFAFIDSQNLNLGIKSQGWNLDWRKFRQYLRDKCGITKAFLFIGYVAGNERLYGNLQSFGYILILKPTLELKNGNVKGNVDADLVLHAMIEYPNYKQAVVVSGDGDFYCLVEHLVSKNITFGALSEIEFCLFGSKRADLGSFGTENSAGARCLVAFRLP